MFATNDTLLDSHNPQYVHLEQATNSISSGASISEVMKAYSRVTFS